MAKVMIAWLLVVGMLFSLSSARIIEIPGEFTHIQDGIDASSSGDTVLVFPGTYYERINFNGHDILLCSFFNFTGCEGHIASTIIDGSAAGTVVVFENGETRNAILSGFTIRNGSVSVEGGGIRCAGTSPTICSNIITGNRAGVGHTGNGGGICCYNYSSPLIKNNIIKDNYTGFLGGGIHCRDYSDAEISNNIIAGNYSEYQGGGLQIRNYSLAKISNNIVYGNFAVQGGGIYTWQANVYVTNSIFWADTTTDPGHQEIWSGSPNITYCDVQTGWSGQGCIDSDPRFRDPASGDFHLMSTGCGNPFNSPCIDAGHPDSSDFMIDCKRGLGSSDADIGAFGGFSFADHSLTAKAVPCEFATIQLAINGSGDGDSIFVDPGSYSGNINFNGRDVVLSSMLSVTGDPGFISSTVLDGLSSGTVVVFENGETRQAVLAGFTITNGMALEGGGIRCDNSSPTISSNLIAWNSALSGDQGNGGGICCINGSSPLVSNNIIAHNYGRFQGGGFHARDYSLPVLANNIILRNHCDYLGGGLHFKNYSHAIMANNIIYDNFATQGGGMYTWLSSPYVTNSIFWADSASHSNSEIRSGSGNISYCDIRGGWSGTGCIDTDPLFRDPMTGDFHLQDQTCGDAFDSPCIDTGHPDSVDIVLDCLRGLGAARSDMGAYGGAGGKMPTGIEDDTPDNPSIPVNLELPQNYPNPFNTSTIISYSLPAESRVTVTIYNILGQSEATIFEGLLQPGRHSISWRADDYPSGIYFARIDAGGRSGSVRMVLIK